MIDIGKKIIDDCPHLSHDGRCDICEEAALTAVWNAAVEACAEALDEVGAIADIMTGQLASEVVRALSTAKAATAPFGSALEDAFLEYHQPLPGMEADGKGITEIRCKQCPRSFDPWHTKGNLVETARAHIRESHLLKSSTAKAE